MLGMLEDLTGEEKGLDGAVFVKGLRELRGSDAAYPATLTNHDGNN
jgi:hypothetical protein